MHVSLAILLATRSQIVYLDVCFALRGNSLENDLYITLYHYISLYQMH